MVNTNWLGNDIEQIACSSHLGIGLRLTRIFADHTAGSPPIGWDVSAGRAYRTVLDVDGWNVEQCKLLAGQLALFESEKIGCNCAEDFETLEKKYPLTVEAQIKNRRN